MQLADTLKPNCDMWAVTADTTHCQCTAPASLLGGNHTVVEIGANDGVHMSNSWFFEKHLGWKGMCVEANPVVYRRLQANRPGCMHVNALVGPTPTGEPPQLPFLAFHRPEGVDKQNTARDWETGLAGVESTDAPHKEICSLAAAQAFAKRTGLLVERTALPVIPFATLFEQHGIRRVDFMSVDVEGAEFRVLSSIDFRRVWIRMIATETTDANVTALLRRKGFRDINVAFALGDHLWVNERHPHVHGEVARARSARVRV